ncbi:MAG: hypothetical protein K9I85_12810 [Saprospiraceae bacterium]|nr:hypothetical protein [Saprospiraceae bacterium]
MSNQNSYGHGKLLITGEYLVVEGAEALAVPLKLGQQFVIRSARGADLHWKSLRPDGSVWFQGLFSLLDFTAQECTDEAIADRLTDVLTAVTRQNPDFLSDWKGQKVESKLEFDPEWGFGSSSTLIHAIAEWGEVDAYTLYEQTFGGSGYDLACATADGPIIYKNTDEEIHITPLGLEWPFKEQILLVYSGQKTSSKGSVEKHALTLKKAKNEIEAISAITQQVADAETLEEFTGLISDHNARLSKLLGEPANPWVPNYPGLIKPLGAWGGDFFLAASPEDPYAMKKWLADQGFSTVFGWKDLVLEG